MQTVSGRRQCAPNGAQSPSPLHLCILLQSFLLPYSIPVYSCSCRQIHAHPSCRAFSPDQSTYIYNLVFFWTLNTQSVLAVIPLPFPSGQKQVAILPFDLPCRTVVKGYTQTVGQVKKMLHTQLICAFLHLQAHKYMFSSVGGTQKFTPFCKGVLVHIDTRSLCSFIQFSLFTYTSSDSD